MLPSHYATIVMGALVVRLNPDGTLDATFGLGGIGLYNDNDISYSKALCLQKNGKIIVAGYCTYHDSYSDSAVLVFRLLGKNPLARENKVLPWLPFLLLD